MTKEEKELSKYAEDLISLDVLEKQELVALIDFYIKGLKKKGYMEDIIKQKNDYLIEHIKKKFSKNK